MISTRRPCSRYVVRLVPFDFDFCFRIDGPRVAPLDVMLIALAGSSLLSSPVPWNLVLMARLPLEEEGDRGESREPLLAALRPFMVVVVVPAVRGSDRSEVLVGSKKRCRG